jgi:ferrous iron transport protein A
MTAPRNLSQMLQGHVAMIRGIGGHPTLRSRLQELGFTPGATVRMVARAAFGGALAVQLRGSTIALRRTDAACVEL